MIRLLWAGAPAPVTSCGATCPPTSCSTSSAPAALKWGLPAMLLAGPCLLAASIRTHLIADGAHGWLNLVVILFVRDALKFLIMGPVSVFLLTRARIGRPQPADARSDGSTL